MEVLADFNLKRIHVNQHKIRAGDAAPLSVKHKGKTITCSRVKILGESEVVHRPEKPLSCGARVWIETNARVICE